MNEKIFWLINNLAGRWNWLDVVAVFCAQYLFYVLILGVVIYFVADRRRWQDMAIISIGSAIIARFGLTTIIRWSYYHPRPYWVLQNVHLLLAKETEASFPSGHTIFAFALAMGVYLYNKKLGRWYFIAAGLIGVARVFVGAHWPFDIVAGAALGILVTYVCNWVYQKYKHNFGLK